MKNRFMVDTIEEARVLLVRLSVEQAKKREKKLIILVGENEENKKFIEDGIEKNHLEANSLSLPELLKLDTSIITQIGCITSCDIESKKLTKLGLALVKHPQLSVIPFEYITLPANEYEFLKKHDGQNCTTFVSPLLLSDVNWFDIYAESLKTFEKKCQIRDYYDICQLLEYVVKSELPGSILEFGSYKGHSGFLMANILKAMKSDKKLFMFDTFEEFPTENIGVDAFWSKSHLVNFEEVSAKFKDLENVKLVKGDFTQTLPVQNIKEACFIFIDCDSYRGTKFILENVFDKLLVPNGVIVLEDYGHQALLGNRIAFHEFFDHRKDCFKFFSQFSGFQIITKAR